MTRHLAAAREELRVGNLFAPLLNTLGTLFSPVHFVFQYVFYQPVFNVLMLVYAGVHSFALAIVILTLLIRSSLIPLTRRQLRSSKVMQELAPQLNELRAQYKDNPQELMAAQQALYKEHGVSLYGGCLPLLVQLPFLYALYYSFFTVLNPQNVTKTVNGRTVTIAETVGHHLGRINADIYPFLPHLTQLPATQFFWTSLAHPDPLHILPVLAGVLTFIQLRMSLPVRSKTAPRAASAGPDPSQSMQIMQYIMPVITITIGLSFPAGLALYWCITTAFSAVQQYFISGWGSLFVGVPGMERFVPPPKDTTPPTTSAQSRGRSLTSTSSTARSSLTGSSDASPQAGAPGGGFWQRIRASAAQATAQAAAAQKAAEEAAADRQREIEQQRAARRAANAGSNTGGSGTGGASGNARRPRPAKAGATLVKPPTTASGSPNQGVSTSADTRDAGPGEPPETALARDGASASQGKPILPEQAIARDAVREAGDLAAGSSTQITTAKRAAGAVSAPKGVVANGGAGKPNGANRTNGANGANGSRAGASAKNSQPQRPRSNGAASRPKGGR